jgi:L-fuculose-phosphate aldolase
MHGMIYQARPEVKAVLHTHATYSSVLAVARKPLPPILGILKRGGTIPVADYGPTGSPALAANALKALGQKDAVILANHGAICVGADLSGAYAMCELLEWASRIYIMANSLGRAFEIETA